MGIFNDKLSRRQGGKFLDFQVTVTLIRLGYFRRDKAAIILSRHGNKGGPVHEMTVNIGQYELGRQSPTRAGLFSINNGLVITSYIAWYLVAVVSVPLPTRSLTIDAGRKVLPRRQIQGMSGAGASTVCKKAPGMDSAIKRAARSVLT